MEPEGLIFDCDGTLVDTMPIHFKAWSITTKKYGLIFPEDRFYALGGLFLYSLIPISHRLMIYMENPEDNMSYVSIVIFLCQAILAFPRGGFLSPNSDSTQKTWSLKVQSIILVINAAFALLILRDPIVPTILGVYHAIYALMMIVAISKTIAGKMDLK